jgi:hypothetical protein
VALLNPGPFVHSNREDLFHRVQETINFITAEVATSSQLVGSGLVDENLFLMGRISLES